MISSSEPRPFPFTNDVGTVYDIPEKPPLESEQPPMTAATYDSAPTASASSASRSTISLNAQRPPFNAHQPNHAFTFPSTSTRRPSFDRFTIPTKTESLSSGFPYDPRVYDLISHDEWHLLSSDIVNAAKLSVTEDFAAWTTGVTTGTLSSGVILVFGPVVGYYAGRAVHRKTVIKTVKERLDRDGDLRSVLRRWNEQKFGARGFQAWLELPVESGELKLETTPKDKNTPKKQRKAEEKIATKIAKRFRIAIIPNSETGEQTPSYTGHWSHGSPVSVARPISRVVEAPGNEHRDLVELRQDRDPAELNNESGKTATDRTNSITVRLGSEIASKVDSSDVTSSEVATISRTPRRITVPGEELEGVENRVELE